METTAETFVLRNDEPKPTPWTGIEPERRRQSTLFSGLDCLAGQQDLFSTDGEEAREFAAEFYHGHFGWLQHDRRFPSRVAAEQYNKVQGNAEKRRVVEIR